MSLSMDQIRMRCTEEGTCLLWNQGLHCKGYPQARIDGRPQLVHRYVYTQIMGREVPKNRVVSNRCGNRLCVSPQCLTAITYGARLSRAYKRGNRLAAAEYVNRLEAAIKAGKAKLSFEIADHIRAERMDETNEALAKEYGVHPKTIYEVKRGKRWMRRLPASSVFNLANVYRMAA